MAPEIARTMRWRVRKGIELPPVSMPRRQVIDGYYESKYWRGPPVDRLTNNSRWRVDQVMIRHYNEMAHRQALIEDCPEAEERILDMTMARLRAISKNFLDE
jgi:hypothetical protein